MILRSLSRLGTAQILAQEQLTQRSVATVLEGARSLPRRNRLQRLAHRLDQHLAATSPSFAQQCLEFGKRLFFYGVEVRRIGW